MSRRRLAAAAAALGAASAAWVAPALAQTLIIPTNATARLEGNFAMRGRINQVQDVLGEHVGEIVHRNWTFRPMCQAGVCRRIVLTRRRSNGTDTVVLYQRSAAYYTGTGAFYAPLQCAGSVWHRGSYAPFTITVRITGAAVVDGVVVASKVRAFYHNAARYNRTPCVVSTLGHDDAEYTGAPAPVPPA
jgi:hypothetical protein